MDLEAKEAKLFAAELLMPEGFLAKDVETIGTVDPPR
jgi:Zn-dependent peptidase ImmA (M78 family)